MPALALAVELGNPKGANSVLPGALARDLDFDGETWTRVLTERLPPKVLEINLKAFERGYQFNAEEPV